MNGGQRTRFTRRGRERAWWLLAPAVTLPCQGTFSGSPASRRLINTVHDD